MKLAHTGERQENAARVLALLDAADGEDGRPGPRLETLRPRKDPCRVDVSKPPDVNAVGDGVRRDAEPDEDVARRRLADGEGKDRVSYRSSLAVFEERISEGLDVVDRAHDVDRTTARMELEEPAGRQAILGVIDVVPDGLPFEVVRELGGPDAHELRRRARRRRRGDEAEARLDGPEESSTVLVERVHGHVAPGVVERVREVRGVHDAAARRRRVGEERERRRGHAGLAGPKPVKGCRPRSQSSAS